MKKRKMKNVNESVISRILSAHQGHCRRFAIPERYLHYRGLPTTTLDGWLESPALHRLQELEFHYGCPHKLNLAPPPASVHRFSSTLHAVSFGGCGFTDGNNASGLHFPVLKQLSLSDVRFSESSLHALLSSCPVLQSLLLTGAIGFPHVQIASRTLRSISGGSGFLSLKMVVHSVKILSLSDERLSLDVVIKFMKCFPCLERLYIQTRMAAEKNVWCHKYRNLIDTLDVRLKKIVLAGYRGNTSHVNFVNFFVLNARMLESVRLELYLGLADPDDSWIDKQHRLLQTKNKASRDMQLDFASKYGLRLTHSFFRPEQVHDLSTADPFP